MDRVDVKAKLINVSPMIKRWSNAYGSHCSTSYRLVFQEVEPEGNYNVKTGMIYEFEQVSYKSYKQYELQFDRREIFCLNNRIKLLYPDRTLLIWSDSEGIFYPESEKERIESLRKASKEKLKESREEIILELETEIEPIKQDYRIKQDKMIQEKRNREKKWETNTKLPIAPKEELAALLGKIKIGIKEVINVTILEDEILTFLTKFYIEENSLIEIKSILRLYRDQYSS